MVSFRLLFFGFLALLSPFLVGAQRVLDAHRAYLLCSLLSSLSLYFLKLPQEFCRFIFFFFFLTEKIRISKETLYAEKPTYLPHCSRYSTHQSRRLYPESLRVPDVSSPQYLLRSHHLAQGRLRADVLQEVHFCPPVLLFRWTIRSSSRNEQPLPPAAGLSGL